MTPGPPPATGLSGLQWAGPHPHIQSSRERGPDQVASADLNLRQARVEERQAWQVNLQLGEGLQQEGHARMASSAAICKYLAC